MAKGRFRFLSLLVGYAWRNLTCAEARRLKVRM
jgi:hypothetical protein